MTREEIDFGANSNQVSYQRMSGAEKAVISKGLKQGVVQCLRYDGSWNLATSINPYFGVIYRIDPTCVPTTTPKYIELNVESYFSVGTTTPGESADKASTRPDFAGVLYSDGIWRSVYDPHIYGVPVKMRFLCD